MAVSNSGAAHHDYEVDELGNWTPSVQILDEDGVVVPNYWPAGSKAYWTVRESYGGAVLLVLGPSADALNGTTTMSLAISKIVGDVAPEVLATDALRALTKADPGYHELQVWPGGDSALRKPIVKGNWWLSRGTAQVTPEAAV